MLLLNVVNELSPLPGPFGRFSNSQAGVRFNNGQASDQVSEVASG